MNSAVPFPGSNRGPADQEDSRLAANQLEALRHPKTDTLKIIVVGTPKTGNTWVKHLLAEAYGLPPVRLKPECDLVQLEAAGPRWISHQHFLPQHDLLAWGATHNVVFVSVVRHPGDVLVSLWHHMQNRGELSSNDAFLADSTQAAAILRDGTALADDKTKKFVEDGFHLYLNLSIAWLGLSGVRSVRYEDLWQCPLESLRKLTSTIWPLSDERLCLALCACELELMQSLLDPEKIFLRKGGIGGWRSALSAVIKQRLAKLEPYPAQFAALGYSMDENDPANEPHPTAGVVVGPFGTDRTFADGTAVAPVLMKAYFDCSVVQRRNWPDPRSTAKNSFFNWLNRPAAADTQPVSITPVITELAHYLYSARSDLRKTFPDLFGAHRAAFYDWFLANARQEYGLDRVFVPDGPFAPDFAFDDGVPVARLIVRTWFDLPPSLRLRWPYPRRTGPNSFFAWLNSPAAADPAAGQDPAIVSELAAYLYSIRPDISAAFPDLFGRDRLGFVEWFIVNARREYGLDDAFVRLDPFTGLNTFSDGTRTSRVLVRAYLGLPEAARKRWSNPAAAGEGSFLAWLNSPAAADPTGGALAPAITELGAYLHSIRADVRTSMPDLYGAHRVDFSRWFLSSAVREYDLDRAFTLPVIRSWAESADRVPPHVRLLINMPASHLLQVAHGAAAARLRPGAADR